jgi:hypothetical protein
MEPEQVGVRPIHRIVNGPVTVLFDESMSYQRIGWILQDIGQDLEKIGPG